MASHRSVARSSLHTSLTSAPEERPPHTTSPGRVRRNSFAPARDALHTLITCHAPTSPLCFATRAHTSGSAVARSTAQLSGSSASVLVGAAMVLYTHLMVCQSNDMSTCPVSHQSNNMHTTVSRHAAMSPVTSPITRAPTPPRANERFWLGRLLQGARRRFERR
jgi:hypothetical protein